MVEQAHSEARTRETAVVAWRGIETQAAQFPNDVPVQALALQIRDLAGLADGLGDAWLNLVAKGLRDGAALRMAVRALTRERRLEAAIALVESFFPEENSDYSTALQRAEMLDDARDHERADALFRRLVEQHPRRRDLRVAFAKRLRKRGQVSGAMAVIAPVVDQLSSGSKALELAHELERLCHLLTRLDGKALIDGADARVMAMRLALLHFADRVVDLVPTTTLGNVALVTGSTGPGGAERQLTRLACLLEGVRRNKESVGGIAVAGLIEVVVKSHGPEQRKDFFLPSLREMGVPSRQINAMVPVSARKQAVTDNDDLLALLEFLPPQVHYGVTRLTPYLRTKNITTIGLWQDGACLFGALAALLAGVPRIQLTFRGLPPNVRHERQRPEYEPLYQALAQVPGVEFLCNSIAAAHAYSDWLAIPVERFIILYNGVEHLPSEGAATSMDGWAAFAADTSDATETIGGVFRFESDKRPLHWIRMAGRYLKLRPASRFVIVGNGRLLDAGMALAAELGIDKRILFVGHSTTVGFWYDKMDVSVLMSRFEGLPNVLIEAQLHGVPVVSTPAGGASECFLEGVTGHILSCAEKPDLDEACEKIRALVYDGAAREKIGRRAIDHAVATFSVPLMLERFVQIAAGHPVLPPAPHAPQGPAENAAPNESF